MPIDRRNLVQRIREGFSSDLSSIADTIGLAPLEERPMPTDNYLVGPNERINQYKRNLARAGAYEKAPESYRRSLPEGIDQEELARLRTGLAQHNEYLAQQKNLQKEKLQQAVGLKSKKVIETDPSGKQTVKQNFKTNDGTEVTIKSMENPYQKQYEQMLQQGMQQNADINLQPLAQLVDTWTGSNFAPGMLKQQRIAQEQKNQRLRMAGALASEGQKPIAAAENKRRWEEEMKLKREGLDVQRLRAALAGKKASKSKDIVKSLGIGEARAIENTALRDNLRRQDVYPRVERGLSKDPYLKSVGINIPSGWDKPLELIAKSSDASDISTPKKAMIEVMRNNALAAGYTDEDIEKIKHTWNAQVDITLENIRNALEREGQ
jgi:hypothetical protein